MICPNCKETVNENAKFCPNCGQKLTRTKRPEEPLKRRRHQSVNETEQSQVINSDLADYLKNNIVLIAVELIITVLLIWWKYSIGLVVLALVLIAYYIRATSNNGKQEKLDSKLREITKKKVSINRRKNGKDHIDNQSEPKIKTKRFANSRNLIGVLAGAGVTLIADFMGNFVKLNNVGYNTTTNMSLYDAFKMNGITNSLMNTFNIQFNIQPIMLIVFYVLVIIPIVVIILAFIGGRLVRTLISLLAFICYLGMFVFINIETTSLSQVGISLGLTPGFMMYVAIFSTFIMMVYSLKLKKNRSR